MSLSLFLAAAAPFADLAMIDQQVAQFTGASVGAEGGAQMPLDRRLRLRPCTAPLALAWRGARRETVIAECPDAGGWRLFVPVRAAAQGSAASPAINRGDAVTIAVTGGGFSVSQPGEALEAGPVGGWIRVRGVNGKGQQMRAQVLRPGLVGLPLP
jgi:flagellar basal body P-ring formation protein FlgA